LDKSESEAIAFRVINWLATISIYGDEDLLHWGVEENPSVKAKLVDSVAVIIRGEDPPKLEEAA
jgi:hypothetical protein